MLDCPAAERHHGALDEALSQPCQAVLDTRWRFGMRVAVDQAAGEQPMQGVGQDLVADAADRGAQLAASTRSRAKSRQHNGIPGVGEEIGGRAQTAVSDQLIAGAFAISHLVAHHRAVVTHRSVRNAFPKVTAQLTAT